MDNQQAAIVQRVIKAVNERDLSAVAENLHPDLQRHDLAGALPEFVGGDEAVNLIQMLLRALPDLHIEPLDVFSGQNRVAARIRVTGTHTGEAFLGAPGTGQQVDVQGINLYRFENGKVRETWQLIDALSLMRQLGTITTGPR